MFHVGLTGNVASGKSVVSRLFDAWGATVIDADQLTRDVQQPGSPTLDAIARRFGAEYIAPDGSLNRDALRRHVMAHETERAALNRIVHPAVQAARAVRVAEARDRGDLIVVSVIPLLFEVLDPAQFEMVVLVDAPEAVRRNRLVESRQLTPDDADRLLAAQHPAAAKRARSHIVIDNEGSLADLERTAWNGWRTLRARAAAAATARTPEKLVAIVAHAADAAHAMGGTLARYIDAGYDVHVLSATDAFPGTALDLEHSTLGRDAGHLDPHDAAAIHAVGTFLREESPSIVLTLDVHAFGQHRDHGAVQQWITRATVDARVSAPHARATGGPRADGLARGIAIDVRPWRDLALHLAAAVEPSCGVASLHHPTTAPEGREWFVTEGGRADVVWDLSALAERG